MEVTAAGGGGGSAGLRLGAGTCDVDSVLAGGTESGNTVRGALGVGIGVSAGTRIEVDAGDVRGTVTCAGGGAAPVLTETASEVTAGDRVPVAAEAGPVGADSVLAGGTESGNTVRGGLREGVGASAGPRVEVDAGNERGTAPCAGTAGAVAVLTGPESGVVARDGVETVACAGSAGAVAVLTGPESGVAAKDGVVVAAGTGAGGAVPVLAATESGGGVRVDDGRAEPKLVACAAGCRAVPVLVEAESGDDIRVGVTAAPCPNAGLRVDAEGALEGVDCFATGRVFPA